MADRKTHRKMTAAEQVRRSESRYGRGSSSPSPRARTSDRHGATPRASRRAMGARGQAPSRAEGVDAYSQRRRKNRRRFVLRTALVTVLVALIGVGTAAAVYIMRINSNLTHGVTDELRQQLVAVEPQQPFYMLLLGVDKSEDRANEWGDSTASFRSDTIILARVDPPAQKVTLVSIPRDTLVDMGSHGEQKINAAYSYGGAAYMVEVVSKFSGVNISHYAEIDFEQFTTIVDTIGGIEVTLPVDVIDEVYAGINLTAGTHQIDGATALALCRSRHAYDAYGGGDFFRAANQRMVIASIVKKVLQQDPLTMAGTVSELAESVVTDFTVVDIVGLAAQFQNLDVDNSIYSGMCPTNSQYIDSLWYEIPDEQAWAEMMRRVEAGESPYSDASQDFTAGIAGSIGGGASVTGSEGEGSGSSVVHSGTVLVLNGTQATGLAGSVATTLERAGFSPVADNAGSTDHATTVIYYNGGGRAAALGVAETLGMSEESVSENNQGYSTSYDVVVVLGGDQA